MPINKSARAARVEESAASPDWRLEVVGGGTVAGSGSYDDLRAMDEAARAAGAGFAVQSAFRDHASQQEIFQEWVATIGEAGALAESARPGHSEHQLGTALDLRSAGTGTPAWEHPDWGQTPAGAWLRENSWQYGFVLSYPEGQSAVTCYDYESWHFRYVGREMAEQMRTSGLTPREHLWRGGGGGGRAPAAAATPPPREHLWRTSDGLT